MGHRVLIVEDEQIVAADLASKLERMNCEVVGIAASGGEAVRLAQERRPDVVFMDIQLQGEKDGIETAGELQRKTGLPIIFITAFAEVFLRNPQFMRPPGICLSKPFSISQLQAAIEALGDQAGTE